MAKTTRRYPRPDEFRVIKLTATTFKKYIMPRLREGYSSSWADYRTKHPEVYGVLVDSTGKMYGVTDKQGRRFNPQPRTDTLPRNKWVKGQIRVTSAGKIQFRKV